VVNGHIYPQVDVHPSGIRYAQRNLLFRNEEGRFREVTEEAGPGFAEVKVSRGGALGDYANDGDLDLLVMNLNERATLLHNFGGNRHNWLGLELEGVESNRDGLGARVRLFTGERMLTREAQRGYGYQSQHDSRVLFGLGQEERVERVEIRWPRGRVQVLEEPELRRYLVVREGSEGIVASYAGGAKPEEILTLTGSSGREKGERGLPPKVEHPDWTAEDHHRSGVELYKQGRYEEALDRLRLAIQLRPDYIQAYYAVGVVLYGGLGRSEEAVAVLEQAVERDSSRAEVYQLLGVVYLNLNQTGRAIEVLERATALDPSSWQAHNRLGLAYLRRGDLEVAAVAFQRAVRVAPLVPTPHLSLSKVYERQGRRKVAQQEHLLFEKLRRMQEDVDLYLRRVGQDSTDTESHFNLGRAYMEQRRDVEALRYFQRAAQLDPRYGLAYYGMGSAYYFQGKLGKAIEAYEQAFQADSSLVMALNDLGQAYHQAGRLKEAVEVYQKVIRLKPDLALASSNLGEVYADQGRRQEAIASYRAALEIDSTLVEARNALAGLYAVEGRLEEAIREWKMVLRLAPEHPTARTWIPWAQERLSPP